MNKYWTKSIILHIAVVILLAISGLSFCTHDDEKTEEISVTVEIMPIGEKTNVKPAPKNEEPPKPAPPKKEEPKEEPKKEEEKPKEKEKPKEEPKPELKPEPKKDTKKTDDSELDNLLKSLDDKKPIQKTQSKQTENTDTKSKSSSDFDPNAPLTVSEHDFIINSIIKQIEPCWNIPAGAKDAGNLSVTARIMIEKDGTMKFVDIDDEEKYLYDPYLQIAADSVKRAILDPKCNPLKQLPLPEKYHVWKKLKLEFDPSKMIY